MSFSQLASDLQAFLLQLQGNTSSTLTTTSGTTSNTGATAASYTSPSVNTASGAAAPPSSDAPFGTDSTSGTSQAPAPRHHRHHPTAQETGGTDQLETDATNLLNDLTGKSSSGATASAGTTSTATAAASANTASANTAGTSMPASFQAAFQAYVGTGSQSSQPTQLGFA